MQCGQAWNHNHVTQSLEKEHFAKLWEEDRLRKEKMEEQAIVTRRKKEQEIQNQILEQIKELRLKSEETLVLKREEAKMIVSLLATKNSPTHII
jgi:hypothetical protein